MPVPLPAVWAAAATRAAGCELLGNLDNAKSAILSEVEAVLDAPQEEA